MAEKIISLMAKVTESGYTPMGMEVAAQIRCCITPIGGKKGLPFYQLVLKKKVYQLTLMAVAEKGWDRINRLPAETELLTEGKFKTDKNSSHDAGGRFDDTSYVVKTLDVVLARSLD